MVDRHYTYPDLVALCDVFNGCGMGLVAFRSTYQFDDQRLTFGKCVCYLDLIIRLAKDIRLVGLNVFGDWDGSALTAQSPEIIVTLGPA